MKVNRLIHTAAPIIAFIIGIWYFCIRILGYQLEYIPGDLGDSRFINFLLEHGHRWITGDIHHFWDAGFMYPFKNTIALSDSMLGTLPIYSFWRILGFSPETSYQLWWIGICTLNYWISYAVFKKWFGRWDVAMILAWIFAFSIFNLGQLNYMQMIIRFIVPVAFYAAYKLVNTPSIKYLFIYCFSLVFQFYCVAYTGFYLMYFSLLFMAINYLILKNWTILFYYLKKKQIAYTALIVIVSLIAMLWLLMPYQVMSKMVGLRLYNEVIVNLPVWKSFLFPPEASIPWGSLSDIFKPNVQDWWLHIMFPGILLILVIVVSPIYLLYNRSKKIKTPLLLRALIITSFIIVLLHIRTDGGLSLYALIFKLPGINSMRVLTRFMHVEIFLLLMILGYAMVHVNRKYLPFLMILVFADNLFSPALIPREKKEVLIERKEVLLEEVNKHDLKNIKAIALIDTNQSATITHLDMMLVAQSIGMKTVNGYSSYCPDEFGEFFLKNTEGGLHKWIESEKINKDEILVIKH